MDSVAMLVQGAQDMYVLLIPSDHRDEFKTGAVRSDVRTTVKVRSVAPCINSGS